MKLIVDGINEKSGENKILCVASRLKIVKAYQVDWLRKELLLCFHCSCCHRCKLSKQLI